MRICEWFNGVDGATRLYFRNKDELFTTHTAAVYVDSRTLKYKAYVKLKVGYVRMDGFDDVPSAKRWVHTVLRMTGCE